MADEAAVMDAPATTAEPPMTPVGEVYEAALRKERGEEPKESTAKPEKPEAAPKTEPKAEVKTPEKKEEPAKPANALDAALAETPEAEEKKEDTPAESALKDLPETLPNDKRGEHWQKARAAISHHEQTISQLQKEKAELTKAVETAKSTPPETSKEIAALQEQLNKYKDAIVAVNLELDPEFRAKYVEGRNALVGKAVSKLNAFGGNGEALKDALGMPEGRSRTQAIKEALGDLEDVERSRVLSFIGEVEKLDDERAEKQGDPQQAWEKLERSRSEARAQQAERDEAYKRDVFEKVAKALPNAVPLLRPVDPSVEGGTEWNSRLGVIKENAFKLLTHEATPEQTVEAAIRSEVQKIEHDLWMSDRQELGKLRTALKEYEASEPGFRGGKPPKKSAAEENLEKSPGQLFNETMAKLSGGDE